MAIRHGRIEGAERGSKCAPKGTPSGKPLRESAWNSSGVAHPDPSTVGDRILTNCREGDSMTAHAPPSAGTRLGSPGCRGRKPHQARTISWAFKDLLYFTVKPAPAKDAPQLTRLCFCQIPDVNC